MAAVICLTGAARTLGMRQMQGISRTLRGMRTMPKQLHLGRRWWREENGLPRFWNCSHIFADQPDWSFADGRPAPLNANQKERYLQQIEYCKTIVRMLKELEEAKEAEASHVQSEQEKRHQVITGKFRPKGIEVFKTQQKSKRATS